MVIEDEELLLQAISKKLTSKGFEPITCTSAKQALDYLANITEYPDVIWLDYYLEDMNGLEFMRELRKKEAWTKIPVVVVSNSASDEKKASMLELGVKEYILKAQYRLEDIIQILREVVEKK
ncbi:MAG: Response regulator receiver domain protein (CheY) [Candidatus Woesebacteria bacterium GW2011_GWB1_39_10b]|nr:MAG: hypothetical protein US72_C0012G0062 [Microgenomates group bacterium GW2011_GWC1_38_12]KKQ94006.1 MAG: Response regulator receiver domain protein (CheY) [Candidatus Woesebacteria bacterium GW2011_GWB1_39_10b]KKR13797.1 MAG: Response regulator receiver domain protein (CheY) [Candidatus Woesebacteria bacterium GW2011_GWA1_39_21b]